MRTIDTLVEDIEALFQGETHTCDPTNLSDVGSRIADKIANSLKERKEPTKALRMSQIGKKDRQLWLQHRETESEAFPSNVKVKFLFGDIIEELLIFLAKEAGHTVTAESDRVEVNEVQGEIDCDIDGVTVDVKSAASRSFLKFKDGSLLDEGQDPFGYMDQISGYSHARKTDGAFLAMDKQLGHIAVLQVPKHKMSNIPERVEHLKEILPKDEMPPLCAEPVPDGKSGNMKLATLCSYCRFKKVCFPDLRTFIYSTGPRYLVQVERAPNVPEAIA